VEDFLPGIIRCVGLSVPLVSGSEMFLYVAMLLRSCVR
jgi:hypothetical protein